MMPFGIMRAQYTYHEDAPDTSAHQIQTNGFFISGSNGLTNRAILKYLNKDYFSATDKKEIINRTFPMNRGGWEYQTEVKYAFKQRKLNYTFMAGISAITAFRYSRETAQLVLNGNSYYAGQMMPLDGLRYYHLNWQHIGIGISGRHEKIQWQGGMQFIYAQGYTDLSLNSGNVYTEANGEYINLRLNGNYINSKGVPYSNPGTAVNWAIHYSISKNMKIGGGMRDWGFIFLNKNTQTASIDTTLHFEGLVLNGFRIPESSQLEDSLKALPGNYLNSGKTLRPLPALSYIYIQGTNGSDCWLAGVDYRASVYVRPAFWASYIKNIRQHGITLGLTAGGYGIFGLNAGYGYTFLNSSVQIQFRGLEGILAPGVFSGAGVYLNFAKIW